MNIYKKEEKEAILENIRRFFSHQYDEDISTLKAEIILHFFTDEIGKYHYNKGIDDATTLVLNKFTTFEDDLFALKKRK